MIYINLDKVGVCTSSVCALHCMLMPFVLVNAGSLGVLAFLGNPILEWLVLAMVLLVGMVAILPSFMKHRKAYVLVLFFSGLLLIINAEFVELMGAKVSLSGIGGALMAYAHYENLKLRTSRL